MDGKKIGNFITWKRRELSLTTEQLAAEVGVSRFVAEAWENGELPETKHLLALAKALSVEVEELLLGSEEGISKSEPPTALEEVNESEELEPRFAAPPPNYYEELRKQTGETDYTDYTMLPSGEDGFSARERKFGYIMCSILLVVLAIVTLFTRFLYLFEHCEVYPDNSIKSLCQTNEISQTDERIVFYEFDTKNVAIFLGDGI